MTNWKRYEYMVPSVLDAMASSSPISIPASAIALSEDWGGHQAIDQLNKRRPEWYDAVPGLGHYRNAKQRAALADAMGRSDEPVHEFAGKLADTLFGGGIGAGIGAAIAPKGSSTSWGITGGLIGATLPNLVGTAVALLKSKRSVEDTAANENSAGHKMSLLLVPGYSAYSWASSVKTANNLDRKDKQKLAEMAVAPTKEH